MVSVIGLPVGTVLSILVMVLAPVTAYLLYRIDRQRGDGRVTVVGKR